jgi:hypothetical protein
MDSEIVSAKLALICAATLVETRIVVRAKSSSAAINFIDELEALATFEIVTAKNHIADIVTSA